MVALEVAEDASSVVGQAHVAWADDAGTTRLATLHQTPPLRILFPTPPADDIATAALVTTSGGLVTGDRLDITAEARAGAAALVTAQAAEKVYRSTGADCLIDVGLTAGQGAWLEWLPQETILFDGARLRRQTRLDVAPGGQVLAGEIVVFGRRARGERFTKGLLRDAWTVTRDGALTWADALHLEHGIPQVLAAPAGFAGAAASATIVYVADDPQARLDAARDLLPAAANGVRAAAGIVNDILVVRWLAADPFELRAAFGQFWAGFRAAAGGRPARLPVLWSC